jgi:hypothetical protein
MLLRLKIDLWGRLNIEVEKLDGTNDSPALGEKKTRKQRHRWMGHDGEHRRAQGPITHYLQLRAARHRDESVWGAIHGLIINCTDSHGVDFVFYGNP